MAVIETDVNGFDRVHIDVRWSGILAATKTHAGRAPRPYRSIVTMVRAADAKTDRGVGLANERCGNCHAPLTNSDSVRCDYCGHDLSTATKEWQLEAVTPYERWHRPMVSNARVTTQTGTFAVASERLAEMPYEGMSPPGAYSLAAVLAEFEIEYEGAG